MSSRALKIWSQRALAERCRERMRSSTTVDATGSSPAVGSSYMITCGPAAPISAAVLGSLGTPACARGQQHLGNRSQTAFAHATPSASCSAVLHTQPLPRHRSSAPRGCRDAPAWAQGGGGTCSEVSFSSSRMMARARATRFFMPPDSSAGISPSTPLSPTCARLRATSSCTPPRSAFSPSPASPSLTYKQTRALRSVLESRGLEAACRTRYEQQHRSTRRPWAY